MNKSIDTIAFLMNGAKLPRGGELNLVDRVLRLPPEQFKPIVFFARESRVVSRLKDAGIEAYPLDWPDAVVQGRLDRFSLGSLAAFVGWWLRARPVKALKKLFRNHRVQAVYCCDNLSKCIGSAAARRLGIPAIGSCHGALETPLLGTAIRVINIGLLDRVFAVSDDVARRLRPWARPGQVRLVRNGVDTNRFDPARVSEIAEGLPPIASEDVVVGVFAAMDGNKGQSVLLHAAARFASMHARPLQVWLAGAGPEESALRALAVRLGIGDSVRFLGQRDDVERVLRRIHILVAPTLRFESFGMTVLEAMSMGLPVIASRLGGHLELVEPERTGLLVSPGDVDGLTSALTRLAGDPELRREYGRRGRARAVEQFSVSATVTALVEELRSLASGTAVANVSFDGSV